MKQQANKRSASGMRGASMCCIALLSVRRECRVVLGTSTFRLPALACTRAMPVCMSVLDFRNFRQWQALCVLISVLWLQRCVYMPALYFKIRACAVRAYRSTVYVLPLVEMEHIVELILRCDVGASGDCQPFCSLTCIVVLDFLRSCPTIRVADAERVQTRVGYHWPRWLLAATGGAFLLLERCVYDTLFHE